MARNIHVDGRRMSVAEFEAAKGLRVYGSLDLYGTGITELPEGLRVGGSLDLRGTGITELPESLSVGGWLVLGTSITALPEDFSVGGSLDLSGTLITALSEGLRVGRSLYLSGSGITALPKGLRVGGVLYLSGTKIANVFYGGTDCRDFQFFGARLHNGWRVLAGCRNFSPAEALAHWADNPECLALANEVIEAADQARYRTTRNAWRWRWPGTGQPGMPGAGAGE